MSKLNQLMEDSIRTRTALPVQLACDAQGVSVVGISRASLTRASFGAVFLAKKKDRWLE